MYAAALVAYDAELLAAAVEAGLNVGVPGSGGNGYGNPVSPGAGSRGLNVK